jgi:heptaprenyl diphosphate synthase
MSRAAAAAPPNPVERLETLIAEDLASFHSTLLQVLEPQRPYLSDVELSIYGRGKKLRPLLLLASTRMNQGGDPALPLPERVIKAAVSLEMLHVATLIHDDIIDKAPRRRGLASVNAARGPEMALLIGDLQFVNAVRCFASAIKAPEDMVLVEMVLEVGAKICCGEIDELMTDHRWSPKRLRDRYFRTIDRKTAVLFQLACETGAMLTRSRKRAVWKMGRYGRLLGRAFQMMDDLSDFVSLEPEAGKLRGTDLMQRRMTLPIIYAMEELGPDSRVSRIMAGDPFTAEDIQSAINDVVGCGGFIRAYGEARAAVIEAAQSLDFFPPGPIRDALVRIAYHVVDRGVGGIDAGRDPPATSASPTSSGDSPVGAPARAGTGRAAGDAPRET